MMMKCEHCLKEINDSEYFESEYGNLLHTECGEEILYYSEVADAYVLKENGEIELFYEVEI